MNEPYYNQCIDWLQKLQDEDHLTPSVDHLHDLIHRNDGPLSQSTRQAIETLALICGLPPQCDYYNIEALLYRLSTLPTLSGHRRLITEAPNVYRIAGPESVHYGLYVQCMFGPDALGRFAKHDLEQRLNDIDQKLFDLNENGLQVGVSP